MHRGSWQHLVIRRLLGTRFEGIIPFPSPHIDDLILSIVWKRPTVLSDPRWESLLPSLSTACDIPSLEIGIVFYPALSLAPRLPSGWVPNLSPIDRSCHGRWAYIHFPFWHSSQECPRRDTQTPQQEGNKQQAPLASPVIFMEDLKLPTSSHIRSVLDW